MITLPAVRFVRCYDPFECRMRNIWMRVTTLDQLHNAPQATELTVTSQTIEEAMVEIRKVAEREPGWFDVETIKEIEKASKQLLDAKDSVYEVI
jgi:hypothetical protein